MTGRPQSSPKWRAGIRAGQRPKLLFEDGRQIRDWVYVGDIVEIIQRLVGGHGAASPGINVCTGVPATLADACVAIARAMNVECPPETVGGFRPGDMRHCLGDTSRVEAVLGRRPRPVAEGIPLAFGAG